MRRTPVLSSLLIVALSNCALADSFGTGGNTFNVDFVTIGNPGNAADTSGSPNPAGSVPSTYRIGKFEISEQMIDKANAVGGLGITKDSRGADKPATSISWNDAARFVNWLNTSSGSTPAYKFAIQPGGVGYNSNANILLWTPSDAGYDPNNLYRNSLARYFLPSVHEWYKAAYYNPTSGVYYDYPTGSNAAPTPVASGSAAGTAVYNGQTRPADVTLAGGLSPYGTMGQGGNVFELNETDFDLVNDSSSSQRVFRGGPWSQNFNFLRSSVRGTIAPTFADSGVGFRVASIQAASVPGDYNGNGSVDAADYVLWRKGGTLQNEVDNPGTVNAADYTAWRQRFGNPNPGSGSSLGGTTVPEPTTLTLIFAGFASSFARRRISVSHNRV